MPSVLASLERTVLLENVLLENVLRLLEASAAIKLSSSADDKVAIESLASLASTNQSIRLNLWLPEAVLITDSDY